MRGWGFVRRWFVLLSLGAALCQTNNIDVERNFFLLCNIFKRIYLVIYLFQNKYIIKNNFLVKLLKYSRFDLSILLVQSILHIYAL